MKSIKTVKSMTRKAIIAKAKSLGYFTLPHNSNCPECGATVIKFNKSNKPYLLACLEGHRFLIPKQEYKESMKCKNPECNVCIGQKHIDTNDGYCYKCKPLDNPAPKSTPQNDTTAMAAEEEAAAEKAKANGEVEGPWVEYCKCGNPLPEGRTTYCYDCVAKTKKAKKEPKTKESAQPVHM